MAGGGELRFKASTQEFDRTPDQNLIAFTTDDIDGTDRKIPLPRLSGKSVIISLKTWLIASRCSNYHRMRNKISYVYTSATT